MGYVVCSFDMLTSVDGGLNRLKLEEMYLFLKENVRSSYYCLAYHTLVLSPCVCVSTGGVR
jgi:hypothetical protein